MGNKSLWFDEPYVWVHVAGLVGSLWPCLGALAAKAACVCVCGFLLLSCVSLSASGTVFGHQQRVLAATSLSQLVGRTSTTVFAFKHTAKAKAQCSGSSTNTSNPGQREMGN